MHELFAQVLSQKDLSKAGDLFLIDDKELEKDLSIALYRIREISNSAGYLSNVNDQSVVEICVTRITSAIRVNDSIEKHAAALVDLLDSCLKHDLSQSSKDEDSPHAKIASDILSCIFLNYSKKSVIELALPTAIGFLIKNNKEVCRILSSYLMLAALENSNLIAHYLQTILDSIIIYKNRSLLRILPELYHANRAGVHKQLQELVQVLNECDLVEKGSLLSLFFLVSSENPKLLEQFIPTLCAYLRLPATCSATLQICLCLASSIPQAFVSQIPVLKLTAISYPISLGTVASILSLVGRTDKNVAKDCLAFLISHLNNCDAQIRITLLQEIKNISTSYPSILLPFMESIVKFNPSGCLSVRNLIHQLWELTHCGEPEQRTVGSQTEGVVTNVAFDPPQPLSQSKSDQSAHMSSLPNTRYTISSPRDLGTTNMQSLVGRFSHPTANYFPSNRSNRPYGPPSYISNHQNRGLLVPQGNGAYMMTRRTYSPRSASSMAANGSDGLIFDYRSNASSLPHRTTLVGSRVSPVNPATYSPHCFTQPQSPAIPVKDTVQQFCEKHLEKIKIYIDDISERLPIPIHANLQVDKNTRYCSLDIICHTRSSHCIYSDNGFTFRTKNVRIWLHLMFLSIQAQSETAVSQRDPRVSCLKEVWDALRTDSSSNNFVRLVTSKFPSAKDQSIVLQELTSVQIFELFENGLADGKTCWSCFVCSHPEKIVDLLQDDGLPALEGQLKEKKGRLKLLKPWKTRYFTLTGATITYNKKDSQQAISNIQTVKALRHGSQSIPTAFEIFAGDQTYVFKAKDAENVEQWIQCIQIAIARKHRGSRAQDNMPQWATLGRPVHTATRETVRCLESSRLISQIRV